MTTRPSEPADSAAAPNAAAAAGGIVTVWDAAAPERLAFERDLLGRARSLPVHDRHCWELGPPELAFAGVRSEDGRPLFGCSVKRSPSRALPGYHIGRVRRLGGLEDADIVAAAVRALASHAAADRRLLRLHVELFMPDGDARRSVAAACEAAGFMPARQPRSYSQTILIPLDGSDDEQFARLTKTGRQNVRAVQKNPVAVRTLTDPQLAPRLDELLRETMARTGGAHRPEEWARIISWCNAHPDLGRLVGLFDERDGVAEPLVAFALGWRHGDFVEYATAASTRRTDLRISLAYGLAWDLITWAKHGGSRWFDFGGVTRGSAGSGDALGGISDFKRYFSTNVVDVGAEYVLEPRRLAAAAARATGRLASLLSSLKRRTSDAP